MAHIHTHTKFG